MTAEVTLGAALPKVHAKSGQRGGKDAETAGQRFGDALAGGADRRETAGALPRGSSAESRPVWKLGAYGARFGPDSPTRPEDAVPDGGFDLLADEMSAASWMDDNAAILPDASAEEGDADTDAALAVPDPSGARPRIERPDVAPAMPDELAEDGDAVAKGRGTPFVPAPTASPQQQGGHVAMPPDAELAAPAVGGRGETARRDTAGNVAATASVRLGPQQGASSFTPATAARLSGEAQPAVQPAAGSAGSGDARFGGGNDHPSWARGGGANMHAPPSAADAVSARVNVLGFSTALAPGLSAMPPVGTTAAGLVSAMEADPTWRAAAREAAMLQGQRGQAFLGNVSTLRIQLHPAELGMVTARLTASGSQLSVEIQVETNDARQRLASDSETILKALRAVGYDVEKVTIQQAPQNASGSQQQGGAGRDPFLQNQQAQQDESGAKGRGERGAAGRDGEGGTHGAGETAADRPGGGIYI